MAEVQWVHCASLNLGRIWMCQLSLMQMAPGLLRLEPESVFWQENGSWENHYGQNQTWTTGACNCLGFLFPLFLNLTLKTYLTALRKKVNENYKRESLWGNFRTEFPSFWNVLIKVFFLPGKTSTVFSLCSFHIMHVPSAESSHWALSITCSQLHCSQMTKDNTSLPILYQSLCRGQRIRA